MIQSRENFFFVELVYRSRSAAEQRLLAEVVFWGDWILFACCFSQCTLLEHLTDQVYTGKMKALKPRQYCSW